MLKRVLEIFKYGDSEAFEIFLSVFVILEVLCFTTKIDIVNIFLLLFSAPLLFFCVWLIVGSLAHNIKIRKLSSYFCFVLLTSILVYLVIVGIGDYAYYTLLGAQVLGFIWIAWKTAIEECMRKKRLSIIKK